MPTPSERHALLFFAAVALLGAGVRFARARAPDPPPTPTERAALAAQLAEVDSARQKGARAHHRSSAVRAARSAKPPLAPPAPPSPPSPLDVDTAPAESLERLPRIGPALAKRIVRDRDSLGAFGSLEGFQRVKGVGPAMARALDPYVTFSGTPRPSPVGTRVSTPRRPSRNEARETRAPR